MSWGKTRARCSSYSTCFIVLLQFIVAPELKRIVAFNQEGQPWLCSDIPNAVGHLKITHCADNTVLDVWYLSTDTQESLLLLYAAQQLRLQQPLLNIIHPIDFLQPTDFNLRRDAESASDDAPLVQAVIPKCTP
jgi:hypothetical protein